MSESDTRPGGRGIRGTVSQVGSTVPNVSKYSLIKAKSAQRIALALTAGVAVGVAAPAPVEGRDAEVSVSSESTVKRTATTCEALPTLTASTAKADAPAEAVEELHAHEPHTELPEYQRVYFPSPVIITGSGPVRAELQTWDYRPIRLRLNGFNTSDSVAAQENPPS
jgi:hypothetical protein